MITDLLEKDSPVSTYRPSKEVAAFQNMVQKDYTHGHNILTKSWTELNDNSVIEDMNRGRRMINSYVNEGYEDPATAWKWRGTRSKARNKAIGMHANLTAAYLIPSFEAQNEDGEQDREFSEFMSDIVEWMAGDENSNYKENFLSLVFAMESDPIVYLGAEYQKVMQDIKIKGEDGRYTKKEILDEVLSGFKAPIYTADQVLISNAFERNLQKHRFNGKRRWIEYDEAKAKYGEHENWDYVKKGFSAVFNAEDNLFYEIKDEDHPNLVEEFTGSYRRGDTEVCFIGGIYMGDTNVENNPMKHRDNFGAPRYNIQQFGYYPIGSHFIFYKSMMNTMQWDNRLYDAMSEIGMNRAILEAEMPVAVSGADKIDTEIMFPNAVISFADKDTKVTPLLPASQLGTLFTALDKTDESLSESSISETAMGQLPPASQKAFTVAQAQANSRKIYAGVGKGLASSVSKYGLLMADIAINHLTVAEVEELVGDTTKLKYRKFILPEKIQGGKRNAKILRFDEGLMGKEMTTEEKDSENLKLLEEAGYPDSEKDIYVANPELFKKMKYLSRADYKELFPRDDVAMQALLTGLYMQTQQDPLVDHEVMLRELMYSYFHGRGDKFVKKDTMLALQQGITPSVPITGQNPAQQQLSPVAPQVPGVQ